jgi:hypothetical protein
VEALSAVNTKRAVVWGRNAVPTRQKFIDVSEEHAQGENKPSKKLMMSRAQITVLISSQFPVDFNGSVFIDADPC